MLIGLEQVTKRFGAVTALEGIDFTAEGGEVVVLCGPNGAGKSTFLQLLVGLLRPTSGSVRVMGHDPAADWMLKRRIGYAGDPGDLIDEMSVDELLCYTGKLRGVSMGIDRETEELIEALQLTPKRDEWIGHLSEGTRRKVSLLQALVGLPPLLLLDEPTSGLDIEIQAACRKHLAAQRGRGATLVIGTHDFRLIDALQPGIVFLVEGRITAMGPLPQLLAEHDCRDAEELILALWPTTTSATRPSVACEAG